MLAAGVLGLAERFRLPALVDRHSSLAVIGAFAAVNGLISIGLMATAALATGSPLIFPSLGPTAEAGGRRSLQPHRVAVGDDPEDRDRAS